MPMAQVLSGLRESAQLNPVSGGAQWPQARLPPRPSHYPKFRVGRSKDVAPSNADRTGADPSGPERRRGPSPPPRLVEYGLEMTYVDILGHPTWISVGIENDETVLLLHGGIVDSRSLLDSIGPALSERYSVAAFDRRAHGRTSDTPDALHYDSMADETVGVLRTSRSSRALGRP